MSVIKTVAIVGSKGFIGKNLCNYFSDQGYTITQYNSNLPFDLNDLKLRQEIHSIDVIIWAASKVNPAIADKSPELVLNEFESWTNSLSLLKLENWQGRLIFLSSGGCVYESGIAPFSEEDPAEGSNAYGKLKSRMETQLRYSGLKHAILRVSNVYGPYQKHGRGQGVIAEWMNCIKNDKPLLVFGSKDNFRDYIYVLDVCRGIDSVLEIESSDTYNLGAGVPTTIGQLLTIFNESARKKLEVIEYSSRNYDRSGFFLDIGKFEKAANWEPNIDIKTGISSLFSTTLERSNE